MTSDLRGDYVQTHGKQWMAWLVVLAQEGETLEDQEHSCLWKRPVNKPTDRLSV